LNFRCGDNRPEASGRCPCTVLAGSRTPFSEPAAMPPASRQSNFQYLPKSHRRRPNPKLEPYGACFEDFFSQSSDKTRSGNWRLRRICAGRRDVRSGRDRPRNNAGAAYEWRNARPEAPAERAGAQNSFAPWTGGRRNSHTNTSGNSLLNQQIRKAQKGTRLFDYLYVVMCTLSTK
jgi:hypothetical protein